MHQRTISCHSNHHHCRGEHKEGYSQSFRHWEFLSALSATIANANKGVEASDVFKQLERTTFTNAFFFDPFKRKSLDVPSLYQVGLYNEALQHISFPTDNNYYQYITTEVIANTTERCALIHSSYRVVATGMEYSTLVEKASESGAFDDMISKEIQQVYKSWSVRRHEYSFADDDNNPRFGKRTTRSPKKEQAALIQLKPLLIDFGGKVDLKNPDCHIYLLEGLRDNECVADVVSGGDELNKILCIKLASGAKHSIMAPNQRICVTNTPLCSISAYLLANIAMVRDNQTILDPFAGSGATLLASAIISPSVQTVGVEIATDEVVSRDDIRQDFVSRNLSQPTALLAGDAMDAAVRDKARKSTGGEAFDVILTDPPYGLREAFPGAEGVYDGSAALLELIDAMGQDRREGTPLLKRGGRLVAFYPCRQGQSIIELLPSQERLERAGLQLQDTREQRLNSGLSRWLLSFSCY